MATNTGREVGKTKEAERQEAIKRYETVKGWLTKPDVQKALIQMAARYGSPERLFQVALNYIRQNDQLMNCSQSSLLAGIVGIMKLGLDPVLKQVHLVPFWNTKKRMLEATLIIDYRGKISLMKRAGEVSSVSANVVYDKDEFQCQFGTDEFIKHIPSEDGDPGEVKGAYVVLTLRDGSKKQDYMPVKRIEQRMAVSKTVEKSKNALVPKEGTPWKEWYEEMCIKTVIHHVSKQVPMSIEERLAEELDNRAELGETQLGLLPGSAEAILSGDSHDLPEEVSPVVIFDQKAEKLVPAEDKALWEEYLKFSAEKLKISIDEIKAEFKDDFDGIYSSFQKYKEKQAQKEPTKEPPKETQKGEIKDQPPLKLG